MIVIIDCKISNLGSVVNIVRKITGAPPVVTSNPALIEGAKKLILPGVGAFDHGMKQIRLAGIEVALKRLRGR